MRSCTLWLLIACAAAIAGLVSEGFAQLAAPSAHRSSHQSQSHRQSESGAAESVERYPELVDITASTGITFEHLSSPEQRYIIESMSGGVALIDYDRDGWPDIYFTNAQSVEMALHGRKARSAL